MAALVRFNRAQAHGRLQAHARQVSQLHLRQMFADDPSRAQQMAVRTEHVYYDYSRQRVTPETMGLLDKLAHEIGLEWKIARMFKGERINETEGRAVLHVALRNMGGDPILVDGKDVMPEVGRVLDQTREFSDAVLLGKHTGATGKRIKNIVAIGIGGSYLGPEYIATALRPYAKEGMNLRFVANVDGTDFIEKTADLDPEETMVVIVSKTFTTAETMQNARTAKRWILQGLEDHPDAISKHFIAVSTAEDKVTEFGIDPANMFGFWDWVGGRYSATSAVGAVPLSLYLGFENFNRVLEGAHWMDRHFATTGNFLQNIPVLSALLDVWNINLMGWQTRALLPYAQGLAKLPAHTQQVEMESNGKRVDMNGDPLGFSTGEVVFGEPGTNGQHSFYQLLHQGTQVIPADFIGFLHPQYDVPAAPGSDVTHHQELLTNLLAQPDALAFGQEAEETFRHFPGNRPSSTMLLEKLDPFTAGLLLAWTEHRAAVKGFLWGINSFDQYGVELGKVLGQDHRRRIADHAGSGVLDTMDLNPATVTLLDAVVNGKLPT